MLANAGHFDVEIDLPALREAATGGVRQVLPLVEQYDLGDDRRLNLLASGRVVNLAAAEGHPGRGHGHVVRRPGAGRRGARAARSRPAGAGVHPVPGRIDREIARLKLASLGVGIDVLSEEQESYRTSWENPS